MPVFMPYASLGLGLEGIGRDKAAESDLVMLKVRGPATTARSFFVASPKIATGKVLS